MIEKMILAYSEFIKKYGVMPLGFILSSDIYAAFKKELRVMYPTDDIKELVSFLGIPVFISNYPCGISFQIQGKDATKVGG